MNETLSGKIAIVTGAGSDRGIGAAIALGLVRAGAKVAFVDIHRGFLDRNVAQANAIGGAKCATSIVADVTDCEAVNHAVEQAISELGGLHILINNAGTVPKIVSVDPDGKSSSGRTWEVSPVEWQRVVSVNVNGPYNFVRAAVGHLLNQGWGRIIGVTTSLDTMYSPLAVPYGPTKAAHEAMVSVLAKELAGTGVTANVVTPGGLTNTNLVRVATKGHGFSQAEMLQPEVMAAPCIWLASGEADGFTDQRIVARLWDETLPTAARLAKAGAPAAWQQLGAQAKLPAASKNTKAICILE